LSVSVYTYTYNNSHYWWLVDEANIRYARVALCSMYCKSAAVSSRKTLFLKCARGKGYIYPSIKPLIHTTARTHARIRTHAHKKCKFDRATSTRFTLDNVNAGGTVKFEFHNSKSSYGKKIYNQYFGNVSTSATRMWNKK